jgi:hypothetical protein
MIKGSENDVVVISKEDWAVIEKTICLSPIHESINPPEILGIYPHYE